MGKTATEAELAELEVFFKQFPEYKRMHQVTDTLKGNTGQLNESKQKNISEKLEELWYKIKASNEAPVIYIETEQPKPAFKWQWAAAAILVLGMACSLFYIREFKQRDEAARLVMHTIHIPYGTTQKLVMPDGTKVTLNAGSEFTYPETFSKNTREVSLNGEGFFEVTKNPKKPFLVHTKKLTVKVLGTVFNVKAYNDDKTTETTLLKGKVKVELKNNPEKTIILLPNEKLMVSNNLPQTTAVANHNVNVAKIEYQVITLPRVKPEEIKETAWLDNRILFTNELFEDVAKQIERKYNVQVAFEDQALKTEQISGLLDQEPLQKAMQIIEMTTPFQFRIEGSTIYLSRKEKQN